MADPDRADLGQAVQRPGSRRPSTRWPGYSPSEGLPWGARAVRHHQLDLIDRLCDGLVILANGRVVAAGTKDDLESRGATKHRLVTDTDAGWVRDVPGLRVDAVDGGTALFEILVPGAGDDLLAQALQRGHVIEFTPVRPTLSEIYRGGVTA